MLLIVLAAAAAGAAPLDLRLVCPGEYQDTETATALTQKRDQDGNWGTATTQVRRQVARQGAARISLTGETGELVYPDGQSRTIKVISADSARIVGEYERKILFGHVTWRMEINRLTADVLVASGKDVAFRGVCAPEPTQPKF